MHQGLAGSDGRRGERGAAAGAGRARRRRRPPGRVDVEGHAAAARDRAGADRRPAACWCWTSPRAPSTRPGGGRCGRCSRSCARGGTAVLLNSHLLSEVELVCDRVVIITRGARGRARAAPTELTAARGVEIETGSGTRRFQARPRGRARPRRRAWSRPASACTRCARPLDARGGLPRGGRGGDGMSGAAVIVGVTLRECLRRRVLAVVALLTAAFLALYAVATHLAFATRGRGARAPGGNARRRARAGRRDACSAWPCSRRCSSGPCWPSSSPSTSSAATPSRGSCSPSSCGRSDGRVFVAARYLAACGICCTYVAHRVRARPSSSPGSRAAGGPTASCCPALALASGVCVVAAISLLGSVYLSTIANGIAVLMVYGAGLVSGLLGQIGYALPSQRAAGRSAATPRGRCRSTRSTRRGCTRSPPTRAASPA